MPCEVFDVLSVISIAFVLVVDVLLDIELVRESMVNATDEVVVSEEEDEDEEDEEDEERTPDELLSWSVLVTGISFSVLANCISTHQCGVRCIRRPTYTVPNRRGEGRHLCLAPPS